MIAMRKAAYLIQDSEAKVRDRLLHKEGFSCFAGSSIRHDGFTIVFSYPSGTQYEVPLAYMLTWFDGPHEVTERVESSGTLRIRRSRRISDNQLISVLLSDGRLYLVAYDTVLMACEPLYEYFGGLTDASKARTKAWWDEHGPVKKRVIRK